MYSEDAYLEETIRLFVKEQDRVYVNDKQVSFESKAPFLPRRKGYLSSAYLMKIFPAAIEIVPKSGIILFLRLRV